METPMVTVAEKIDIVVQPVKTMDWNSFIGKSIQTIYGSDVVIKKPVFDPNGSGEKPLGFIVDIVCGIGRSQTGVYTTFITKKDLILGDGEETKIAPKEPKGVGKMEENQEKSNIGTGIVQGDAVSAPLDGLGSEQGPAVAADGAADAKQPIVGQGTQNSDIQAAGGIVPVVKRPRGRPRKNPLPVDGVPVVKRPRGRPRKNPLPVV